MNTLDTMRQALEALENVRIEYDYHGNPATEEDSAIEPAIKGLRLAIEQAEKQRANSEQLEPVAWMDPETLDFARPDTKERIRADAAAKYSTPLYTTPQSTTPAPEAEKTSTQDPVAYVGGGATFQDLEWADNPPQLENGTPLYTAPPQRQPLTKEQRRAIEKANTIEGYHGDYYDAYGIMEDVEAAHGIGGEA